MNGLFEELLDRYLTDSISVSQRERLFEMIASGEYQERLKLYIDNYVSANEVNTAEETSLRELGYKGLLDKIREHEATNQPARVLKMRTWKRIAVAAAIILVAGTGYYYLGQNRTGVDKPVATTIVKDDVKPGTTGAILTLANGTTIVLDIAGNGQLTNSITKTGGSITVNGSAVEFNTLATPRARQHQLVLADGTQIWLNAESSVTFPTAFPGKQREISITGEAYLEVAKNPSQPFIVKVGDNKVEVLGTHFNIMAYANEPAMITTLLEGSVRVSSQTTNNQQRSTILKPGQHAIVKSNDIKVGSADVDFAVAWKNGYIAFSKADVATVMRQVERWYDVQVEYQGGIPSGTFSGDIPKTANLSELLKLFEAGKIRFKIDSEKRKLTVFK